MTTKPYTPEPSIRNSDDPTVKCTTSAPARIVCHNSLTTPKFSCALCTNSGNHGFTATHYGVLCAECMRSYNRTLDGPTQRFMDDND